MRSHKIDHERIEQLRKFGEEQMSARQLKHADLVHAKPEKIVYPAQLADNPAASAGGSMAGFGSGRF
jgi:hypothetical protein